MRPHTLWGGRPRVNPISSQFQIHTQRLNAAEQLSRYQRELKIRQEQLNTHKMLLNVSNGTLDLTTGEIREHRFEDYLTNFVDIVYDPKAECPLWIELLNTYLLDDQEMVDYLQRAIGYSLTGNTDEQCFFFLSGGGQNGKGTVIRTIQKILASYYKIVSFRTLTERASDSIRNDLARLDGCRVALVSEGSRAVNLDEELIKKLTGQDMISARFLHREYFEFEPQFKLWLSANEKPKIVGTDFGIWRRVKLIPFDYQIPETDSSIEVRLHQQELSGILSWAIQGCLAWQQQGLNHPEKVVLATAEYRDDMDTLGDFIDKYLTVDANGRAKSDDIYKAYECWCKDNHIPQPMKQRTLISRLKDRGFKEDPNHKESRGLLGLWVKGQKAELASAKYNTGTGLNINRIQSQHGSV